MKAAEIYGEAFEQGALGGFGGPLPVGVLDPQGVLAPVVPGEGPVEQGRACGAHVQDARRARGETGAHSAHERGGEYPTRRWGAIGLGRRVTFTLGVAGEEI